MTTRALESSERLPRMYAVSFISRVKVDALHSIESPVLKA